MRASWTTQLRGYVRIEIRGQGVEQCINKLIGLNLMIWNIRRIQHDKVELLILVRDFFRLRPILKQTGCRLHIVKRYGLPFALSKLEHRKLFVVGFIVFLVGIFLLSSLIWTVQVEGYESLTKQDVISEAEKLGIYPFQWKFKLADEEQLARELAKNLQGVAWVGVEKKGTQILIKVVESRVPEEKPLLSPRHLISTSDAVVTQIMVDKGRSLVKRNQRVKQGDILISGILGDEEMQKIVVAKGAVKGIVWHEYKIEIPLKVQYNGFTGESKSRRHLVIGKRALQLTGYGKLPYSTYEIQTKRSVLRLGNYSLPLGWLKENVLEVQVEERMLENNEAKNTGLQVARADILIRLGDDVVILEEKVLHEVTESGKVYMKVLFEVEQEISKEQPIIQGE